MPSPRIRNIAELKRLIITRYIVYRLIGIKRRKVIESCNSLTDAVLRQSDYLKKHPKHKVFVEPKKIIK